MDLFNLYLVTLRQATPTTWLPTPASGGKLKICGRLVCLCRLLRQLSQMSAASLRPPLCFWPGIVVALVEQLHGFA